MKKKNLDDLKDLIKRIKWIGAQSKSVIAYLIVSIIVSSIFSLVGVYNALVSKSLIDSAIGQDVPGVIKWLIVMISIMVIRMAVSPIMSFMGTYSSMTLSQRLQQRIYKHITYSKWTESSKHHSVSLLTRISSDVSTITGTVLGTIPSIISLSVTLIASFATLYYLAPAIATVAVVVGPLLLIVAKIFGSKLKKLYKEIQEEDVKYKSFIQESMNNIMIVKTFCMEENNMVKLKDIQKNKLNLALKNTKIGVASGLSMQICSSTAYFTIFCWGALNIAKGVGTYGAMTAMLQLYNNVQGPFSSLASTFPQLVGSIAAAERLMELEEMSLEEFKAIEYAENFNKPEIQFKDVAFGYTEDKQILNNINLNIKPGETIAFVGPSGEGKTTIIRLILSLLEAGEGEVLLKEKNITEKINSSHRELISYVPQGNTLFSGTIEENLRYGNKDATIEEIDKALESACALDFIQELESGIESLVGERGVGISEGQAQRIAIARAFLRKRPILILDEATSALDPETEIAVLKKVRELEHKPTCIIITHRPSALNICNRIIKLEKGYVKAIDKESILEVATELV